MSDEQGRVTTGNSVAGVYVNDEQRRVTKGNSTGVNLR